MMNWRMAQSLAGVCASHEAVALYACMRTEQRVSASVHMQRILIASVCVCVGGVCLWEGLRTLRRYCWIYPCTSPVL